MENFKIIINKNINDDLEDFQYLFGLYKKWNFTQNEKVEVDFKGCKFLRPNAVVVLGALIRKLQKQGNIVSINLETIDSDVRHNLVINGILSTLGFAQPKNNQGNSIPYREDTSNNEDDFYSYLFSLWLGRGWIKISEELKIHIIQPVLEAYINVFDHAQSPIGSVACGQRYPNRDELVLSIADIGIGIPNSVRKHLNSPLLSSKKCLEWSFEPTKSTKNLVDSGLVGRGNGLKILRDFMRENNGKLEIYSDTGYVCINAQDTVFQDGLTPFNGTFVQISVKCDEKFYSLPQEEDSSEFLF